MKPVALPELVPARTNARPNAETDNGVPADAWQREMEKAQASMWLGHDPVGTRANDTGSSDAQARGHAPAIRHANHSVHPSVVVDDRQAIEARAAEAGKPTSRTAARVQFSPELFAAVTLATRTAPAGPAMPLQPNQAVLSSIGAAVGKAVSAPVDVLCTEPPRHLAAPLALAGTRSPAPDGQEAPEAASAAKVNPTPAQDDADPQAVRVYCQFTAEGLMVWIGAAAQSGFNAQAVAAQLQQALARQSQRLAGLTCNGRAVALPPDSFFHPTHKEPTWPLEQ